MRQSFHQDVETLKTLYLYSWGGWSSQELEDKNCFNNS